MVNPLPHNKSKLSLTQRNALDEPHFLFIITPPNSGSTALSQLINTSYRTMMLNNVGEGHRLIRGLCASDRWNPNKEVDYSLLKTVWLGKAHEIMQQDPLVDIVIEKSPPNMMRMEKIASQFNNTSFIANIRNPYAFCASALYRYHATDQLNSCQRQVILSNLAESWIMRSSKIKELIGIFNVPLLTYESFCADPSSILDVLNLPEGAVETINPYARVKVKDYELQPIKNKNKFQISKLTKAEIECVSRKLNSYPDQLEYFSYSLM